VNAQSGAVTLTGNVPNERVRQNIDGIVREISGVTTVYDQMRILPQATSSSSVNSRVYSESAPVPYNEAAGNIFSLHVQGLNEPDRSMAQRILQELRTDTILQTLLPSVNITVSGGQVVLQGRVQSEQQKRSIYSAVQRATGGNVRNELVVAR
jgi:osmotically-inducible protein OsmY